ncbi:protein N-terminal glutamine amidohydrolase [Vigna radiata var. radiata]|uniref:Protein N-terminal glutamine amidohydrolase n=1 Tax=Vigna radiata var. radiata TaxID=3916 RepID=A0A1S3V3N5_VIGRR|nr:protein N-terminal glutamine amidohydrolase [Vigna radiata var. radiata]
MATSTMDVLHFQHTPFYCEENVYLLCKKLCSDGIAKAEGSDLFVVFISNEKKQIPLWNQKASKRADGVILWDYHVICIQIKQGNVPPLVWDLDSTLPFPSPLPLYVSETIRPSFQLFSDYNRLFRVVHAPLFLRSFASDRRHMKDSGGKWIEEPPPHEPIVAEDGTVHNLNEYINISVADAITDVTISSVKDVIFTQKNGVVIKDNQLEEFICQLSSLE